jgi:hypothetical protein
MALWNESFLFATGEPEAKRKYEPVFKNTDCNMNETNISIKHFRNLISNNTEMLTNSVV